MLELSQLALEKIAVIAKESDNAEKILRLRVLGGGCAGFSYDFLFENQPAENDEVFDFPERRVVVDRASLELIKGLRVEYVDELTTEGFQFNNPNAIAVCGCGTSFAVDKR